MNTDTQPKTCEYLVKRGGPSSNGGWDALNRTRLVACGRIATHGQGHPLCQRHFDLELRTRTNLIARYEATRKYGR